LTFFSQTNLVLAWLWLESAKLLAGRSAEQTMVFPQSATQCRADHGVPTISHTEPSQHCNITHWTNMEETEWFSSALLDIL
jgi:hypothetical protein